MMWTQVSTKIIITNVKYVHNYNNSYLNDGRVLFDSTHLPKCSLIHLHYVACTYDEALVQWLLFYNLPPEALCFLFSVAAKWPKFESTFHQKTTSPIIYRWKAWNLRNMAMGDNKREILDKFDPLCTMV